MWKYIVLGGLVVLTPLVLILGFSRFDMLTREGNYGGGTNPAYTGLRTGNLCSYLVKQENSLTADELKGAFTKLGWTKFANNPDIINGFVSAGETYHISNVYIAAHASLESGNGTSDIATKKKNLFAYKAYDRAAYKNAASFPTYTDGTMYIMGQINKNYLSTDGKYYVDEKKLPRLDSLHRAKAVKIKQNNGITRIEGGTLEGMNVFYASDLKWASKIKGLMKTIFSAAGKSGDFENGCTK